MYKVQFKRWKVSDTQAILLDTHLLKYSCTFLMYEVGYCHALQ